MNECEILYKLLQKNIVPECRYLLERWFTKCHGCECLISIHSKNKFTPDRLYYSSTLYNIENLSKIARATVWCEDCIEKERLGDMIQEDWMNSPIKVEKFKLIESWEPCITCDLIHFNSHTSKRIKCVWCNHIMCDRDKCRNIHDCLIKTDD